MDKRQDTENNIKIAEKCYITYPITCQSCLLLCNKKVYLKVVYVPTNPRCYFQAFINYHTCNKSENGLLIGSSLKHKIHFGYKQNAFTVIAKTTLKIRKNIRAEIKTASKK